MLSNWLVVWCQSDSIFMMLSVLLHFYDGVKLTPISHFCQTDIIFYNVVKLTPVLGCQTVSNFTMVSHWLQFYGGVRLTPVLWWHQTDSSFVMISNSLVLWCWKCQTCQRCQTDSVLWYCQTDSSFMTVSSWHWFYDSVKLTPFFFSGV